MFAYRGAVLGGTLAVTLSDEHASPAPLGSTPATLTLPKHDTTDRQINKDDFLISSLKRGQLVLEVDPVQRRRGVLARRSFPFGSLTW